MRKHALITLAALVLLLSYAGLSMANEDRPGSKDHPLFNRMQGYFIDLYETRDFAEHEFLLEAYQKLRVGGRHTKIRYELRKGIPVPSKIQILKNYENAITSKGGVVLFERGDNSRDMKLEKGDREVWIHIEAFGGGKAYTMIIVERETLRQEVSANLDALAGTLRDTGHVAVYGIHFDTGSALVKPESEPAISQIAKLLKHTPNLKLHVVGHTDNVGTLAANLKLSQERAESIIRTLTSRHGIDPKRLWAFGNGPFAPVASNNTDEGRAKNRRVELVEQ